MLICRDCGDAVNYTIGRLAEKLFSNPNSKISLRRSYLDKTHQFYEKHGGKTIILVLCRSSERSPCLLWNTHVKTVISAAYNVIGALLWVLLLPTQAISFGTLPFQSNLKLMIVGIILFQYCRAFSNLFATTLRHAPQKK